MPSRSVISRTSGAPAICAIARSTLATKSGSRSCLAEMFTLDVEVAAGRLRASPAASRAACSSTTSPSATTRPRLLGDPDEHVRGYVDAVGLPAGERLDAGDVAGGGAHDGLVDQRQVAGGDRGAQRLDELEALEPRAADALARTPPTGSCRAPWPRTSPGRRCAACSRRSRCCRRRRRRCSRESGRWWPATCAPAAERGRGSGRRRELTSGGWTSSRSSANSSPPSRATVSLCRTQSLSRCATSISTASPAAWPKRSLTGLKPSRSTKSSAMRRAARGATSAGRARPGRAAGRGWAGW